MVPIFLLLRSVAAPRTTPVIAEIRPVVGLGLPESVMNRGKPGVFLLLRSHCHRFTSPSFVRHLAALPLVPMDPIEQSKRLAAYQAVDNHIKPQHRVSCHSLGHRAECDIVPEGHWHRVWYDRIFSFATLSPDFDGKGSTVPYVVERIVQQGAAVNKGRVFIPTGAIIVSKFRSESSNPFLQASNRSS